MDQKLAWLVICRASYHFVDHHVDRSFQNSNFCIVLMLVRRGNCSYKWFLKWSRGSVRINAMAICLCFKPVTDEQVFYDKFLCDKFYLLVCTIVCTRNFDNFFYDKCTCSKAIMLAFEQVHLS